MNSPTSETIVKAHCNRCLSINNHLILYDEVLDWSEDYDGSGTSIYGGDTWTLLKCRGCDAIRLRHRSWFSEDCDEEGNARTHEEFFPPSVSRQKPVWRRLFFPLSHYLRSYDKLFDEVYGALASGSSQLATMGIRALTERLMVDQVGDRGTFEKNIAAFFEAGHVAPNQQKMFREILIEAGHAAMHRSFSPDADTVNTLLDILEGIMHAVHYAPLLAEQVSNTIPPRTR